MFIFDISFICGWNIKLSMGAGVRRSNGPEPRPLGRGPSCWGKAPHSPVICDSLRTHRLPAMCRLHNSAQCLPIIFGIAFLTGFHLATIFFLFFFFQDSACFNEKKISQLGQREGRWQWSRRVLESVVSPLTSQSSYWPFMLMCFEREKNVLSFRNDIRSCSASHEVMPVLVNLEARFLMITKRTAYSLNE